MKADGVAFDRHDFGVKVSCFLTVMSVSDRNDASAVKWLTVTMVVGMSVGVCSVEFIVVVVLVLGVIGVLV